MSRKGRVLFLAVPAFAGLALAAAACGSSGVEQQILTNFFRASRVRDNVTLANIAAVSYDARTEGTVQEFKITSVGEEQVRPMQLKQLIQDEAAAKQAESDFANKKRVYQNENLEAIQRVVKAEGEKQTLKGKDAEVQAAWSKWRDEQSEYTKKLSDARGKLNAEQAVARGSLTAPGRDDVDLTGMDVDLVTKQVTVDAQVAEPGGQTVPKTLVITLQRAVGKTGSETKEGRWIITNIKSGAAAPTS